MGWDVSLNHGAMVELTDGSLSNFWYYTDLAGAAAKSKNRGYRVPPEILKIKDKHIKGMRRLAWLEHFMDKTVLIKSLPEFVGIEDYALRAEHGSHQLGEIGGIARILCWFRGVKLRLHDPTTVKMFAAHDGTCQKDEIRRSVDRRWGSNFESMDQPPPKPTKKTPKPKQNRTTSEDLADAFAIAQLVWTEVRIRRGDLKMSDLEHEKEIRVFNRVTKTYPVNLLDRDWIFNPDGVPTPHGEPVCDTCGSRRCCLAKKKGK